MNFASVKAAKNNVNCKTDTKIDLWIAYDDVIDVIEAEWTTNDNHDSGTTRS